MMVQKYFKYKFVKKNDLDNFFVNSTNEQAYKIINDYKNNLNIFLYAPKKSGKSHLLNIWLQNNDAIIYKKNLKYILHNYKNVAIDNLCNLTTYEEDIFHIVNHCKSFNLKIFITSSIKLNDFQFKLKDLDSRLKSFYYVKIKQPDDEMFKILLTKLFYEKQIIIKNIEIFDYVFNRLNRTYEDIYNFVNKLDQLSLEKKRQLTIPLIKEIL